MLKDKLAAPVLKWVGGKRQILNEIMKYIPGDFKSYYEPFLGGGAVLFAIQPQRGWINDFNAELINVYTVIKDNLEELIESLKQHDRAYKRDERPGKYFYRIRKLDRNKDVYDSLTPVEKASRVIFLNKTCFNGLFRVNRAGQFNTPFGYYKAPNIINEERLRAVSTYFNQAEVKITCTDFEAALKNASREDFVYLDPPYDPLSDTASFTAYDREGFGSEEQIRLSRVCHRLNKRGVRFLLSNSATPLILDLYKSKDYRIEIIKARRAVNARGDGRGDVEEVLVRNFSF